MATAIVKKGDTLSALAKKYGITLSKLLELNPNKRAHPELIYIGESLNIPDTGSGSGDTTGNTPAVEPKNSILTGDISTIIAPDKQYFFKFTSDPTKDDPSTGSSTVFLFDAATKTLTPFLSEEAFNNWSKIYGDGETVQEAQNNGHIHLASTDLILPGKALADFKFLSTNNGIQSNGEPPKIDTVDTDAVQNMYGKTKSQTQEDLAMSQLFGTGGTGGYLNMWKEDGISAATINDVQSDASLLHLYTNAMAYGGYKPTDIYKDILRRQLVKAGNTDLTGLKVIDETQPAATYYATPEGTAISSNTALTLPATMGGIDTSNWNYTINNLPKEAFDTLVKPFDWNSEEGKALMNNVKTSYYDIMLQKLDANTQEEQVAADYSYKQLQKAMATNYGIQLSDDANTAWGQLDQLNSSFATRGLAGTGSAEAGIDTYLKGIRKADERIRNAQATDEEQKKFEFYKNSATPEQIAALTDQQKADWGFKPSASTLAEFNIDTLKAKYPDVPVERLQGYIDSVIDENGNYRSVLYNTMFGNKLQLEQDKEAYQLGSVTYDTNGNITGGSGAMLQKALDAQSASRYAGIDKTYFGDNNTPEGIALKAAADKKATDAKAITDKAAADKAAAASSTPYTPASGEAAPYSNETVKTPTQIPQNTWTPPTGYEKISGPSQLGSYTNIITEPGTINKWGMKKAVNTNQIAQNASAAVANLGSSDPMAAFKTWTTGKNDVLGKNWQGYSTISGSDWNNPAIKPLYKNVQSVNGTLYGYKG